MSQQRLAELAACSVSMVRLLESGYRPCGRSIVFERIAATLNESSPAAAPGSTERPIQAAGHGATA